MESRIYSIWYVQPNDVIGGWCIMDVDEPPSTARRPEVADFITEDEVHHIVWLHNKWIESLGG